mmetsp:Transcript_24736/g.53793  ORF Transcript_24736/g.53793 Transcript_24736/m.53793 type:complete len:407 (-) Transcript_24736:294-1514(-)
MVVAAPLTLATVPPSSVFELRQRLQKRRLHPYRSLDGTEAPWEESDAGTDMSLRRFLVAQKLDVVKAEDMFAKHLVWRRRVFPIERSGAVEKILNHGKRLRRIGRTADNLPVIVMDFLWGYFLEGVCAADCLRATLYFVETELRDDVSTQCVVVTYGGCPPLDYAAALASMMQANYPERLSRAAVYPIPRVMAAIGRTVLGMLDPGVAAKVQLHYEENAFLEFLKFSHEELPPNMQGGLQGAEKQFAPDSQARMNKTLRWGLLAGPRAGARLRDSLQRPIQDLEPVKKYKRKGSSALRVGSPRAASKSCGTSSGGSSNFGLSSSSFGSFFHCCTSRVSGDVDETTVLLSTKEDEDEDDEYEVLDDGLASSESRLEGGALSCRIPLQILACFGALSALFLATACAFA